MFIKLIFGGERKTFAGGWWPTWVVVNVDIVDRFGGLICLVEGGVIAGWAADQTVGGAGGELRLLVAGQTGASSPSADCVRAGPAVGATPNYPGLAAAWKSWIAF